MSFHRGSTEIPRRDASSFAKHIILVHINFKLLQIWHFVRRKITLDGWHFTSLVPPYISNTTVVIRVFKINKVLKNACPSGVAFPIRLIG